MGKILASGGDDHTSVLGPGYGKELRRLTMQAENPEDASAS